jgi:hypothetical protein
VPAKRQPREPVGEKRGRTGGVHARTRFCRRTCAWYRTMSEVLTQFEPRRCPRMLPWLAGLTGRAPALPTGDARNPTGDARGIGHPVLRASRSSFSSRMKVLSAIFGRPLSLSSTQTGLDIVAGAPFCARARDQGAGPRSASCPVRAQAPPRADQSRDAPAPVSRARARVGLEACPPSLQWPRISGGPVRRAPGTRRKFEK